MRIEKYKVTFNASKTSFEFISDMKLDPNMKVHSNPAPRKMALAIEFIEQYGLPSQKK